jgi:hypothetical protein
MLWLLFAGLLLLLLFTPIGFWRTDVVRPVPNDQADRVE